MKPIRRSSHKRPKFLLVLIVLLSALIGSCQPRQSTPETVPSPTAAPPTQTLVPQGKTILVTNATNNGPGSFRQALEEAEPYDEIIFDPVVFPPDAPVTITLTGGLPEITQGNLTIDASNAGVILDGSGITIQESVNGLSITSDNNIIRGLQIVGFSDAGIALYSGAQHNLIGGDRSIGDGPLGQGNLICGNGNFGIGLIGEGTSYNTIQGNYIGVKLDVADVWGHPRDGIHSNEATNNLITGNVFGGNDVGVYICCAVEGKYTVIGNMIGSDASSTNPLGNRTAGILLDRTGKNVVGPGNVVAYNEGQGVLLWANTPNNTITQNSIHDNGGLGIRMDSSQVDMPSTPLIYEYDLEVGSLAGWACENCTVEFFSDSGEEGAVYEGQVVSDSGGGFTFNKGSAFNGPYLTATVSNSQGYTSPFTAPISGAYKVEALQTDNNHPKIRIQTGKFGELADNRIGDMFPLDRHPTPCPPADEDWSFTHVSLLGLKWVRLSLDRLEFEQAKDMGNYSQFEINQCQDEVLTLLAENGITIMYTIVYWDAEVNAENYPDYRNEDEVQRFLDYTRMIVRHFKGRVQYYEILNEALFYVKAPDYINLIRRVVPVIREEDPQAKIVVGGSSNLLTREYRDYLFRVLRSDIMLEVDGIAIHAMYGASPKYDDTRQYYYDYPQMVHEIKDTALANGFSGEYFAEEMSWRTSINPNPYEPWEYTPVVAAKYYARGILMNLGMDLWAGVAGEMYDTIPPVVMVVRNLGATMAGARPEELTVKIESEAENIMSYGFSLSNGDRLFTLWTNGAAVDDDPGVSTTLIFPDLSAKKVMGIDVLNGFEQELITETENGGLIIRQLLVKDYPIILRLIP